MAKPNPGDKRICPNCETRYFDFGKLPPTCPKCSTVLDTSNGKAKAKAEVEPVEDVVEAKTENDDEIIDLDDDLNVDDDLDENEDDDGLMEDTSDLGGDDDMSDVIAPTEGKGDDG